MQARETLTLFRARWRQFRQNDQVKLSILALIIGVAVAYGALGVRVGIELIQGLTFGIALHDGVHLLAALPWWLVLLVPAAGGLLIGLFVHHLMPNQRAQGVADVIEAGAIRGGHMEASPTIKAAALSLGAIGGGAKLFESELDRAPTVGLGLSLAW